MSVNINSVVLTGNLTKDPELRATTGGTSVCSLRLAVNGRRKDSSGDWKDDPNFFDITVFGNMADNCAQYLSKGRPVAVQGRLDWREWETQEGSKRQAVQVIANAVQFLNSGKPSSSNGGSSSDETPKSDVPADDAGFNEEAAAAKEPDDDIPF